MELVKRNIEKNVTIVTATDMASKISTMSVAPSKIAAASVTPNKAAQIEAMRNVSFCRNMLTNSGRAIDKIAYEAVSPRVPFISATPADTVFMASLTEEPINGIILAVANFNPLRVALSLLAASVPLRAISARRKENVNISSDIKFFFSDFTIPIQESGGYMFSVTNNAIRSVVNGNKALMDICSKIVNIKVSEVAETVAENEAPANNVDEMTAGVVIDNTLDMLLIKSLV